MKWFTLTKKTQKVTERSECPACKGNGIIEMDEQLHSNPSFSVVFPRICGLCGGDGSFPTSAFKPLSEWKSHGH